LLAELPIEDAIRQAILKGNGLLGQILKTVVSYERCDWDELTQSGISPQLLRPTYLESVEQVKLAWAASAT
jgi:c-di-GMP-related signal transduction protein